MKKLRLGRHSKAVVKKDSTERLLSDVWFVEAPEKCDSIIPNDKDDGADVSNVDRQAVQARKRKSPAEKASAVQKKKERGEAVKRKKKELKKLK